MNKWVNNAVVYHIYPLGFCGAPLLNTGTVPVNRIEKVLEWIPHLKKLGVNAIYFGPVFESTVHGYDTNDYRKIDRRLGDNAAFKKVCDMLHASGIRIILDGVFNHVGRDFWAFKDLQEKYRDSEYVNWFGGINFDGTSPVGDHFAYEGWQGHYNLVKLNVRNPATSDYLLQSVKMWIEEFGIDGLRLDAADCVDIEFWKSLRSFTKSINPDFWLVGEIIHGDYNRWANKDVFDSVTNYECYKGLYSSLNEKNYFEIGYSLNRQFGNGGIYKDSVLYSFLDNHDVNRISSTLKNPEHIFNAYTMMYTMPGIPSIYYGSEWGIAGLRDKNSDTALRPSVELDKIPTESAKLINHIARLGELKSELPALQFGNYEQVLVRNEQLVYKRSSPTQTIYAAFNLAGGAVAVNFKINGTGLCDKLDGDKAYPASGGSIELFVPAFGAMILVEENTTETKPLPEKQGVVIGGKYHHFKGGDYVVLDVGRNSETLEDMVVYKELSGQGNTWIRALSMFTENVDDFGNIKERFSYMGGLNGR